MPEYTCEYCNFKTLIKTKYTEHCETTKHKRKLEKPVEISLSEQVSLLRQKVVSLELINEQQSIQMREFEQQMRDMKLKIDLLSMLMLKSAQVQPVVQPVVEPVVQPVVEPVVQPVVEPVVQPVVQPELEEDIETPERYTEKYLNDNFSTTINEFIDVVYFDEDEVVKLFKNPENFKSLVMKSLQDTLARTNIKNRGMITTDTKRKKMWVLRKPNHWEVDTEATFYIKNQLRYKVKSILDQFIKDNAKPMTSCPHVSKGLCGSCSLSSGGNPDHLAITSELSIDMAQTSNKWEKGFDDRIMEMFEDDYS
jgi:hypothetical protein